MLILDIEKGARHSNRLRSPNSLMKVFARCLAYSAAQQPSARSGGARCWSCQERMGAETTGQDVEESEHWVDLGWIQLQTWGHAVVQWPKAIFFCI